MKKRIVSFILVLVMVIGLMPTVVLAASTTRFAGGSGTKNDPYLISNKTHLDNVRNYLSAHFKMTADIEFTDADFKYGGGFYNSGKGWMPIGMNLDSAFTGTFDGNGFAIKNLYINISSSASTEYAYAGLFGYNKGTIKNLGLVDGEVLSSFPSVSFAGSIAGFNEGAIENCYNTGNVSASSDDSYAYAGGIAGWSAGEIINCYNTGAVAALSSSSESYAYSYAGGVAAENGGTIKNCYNTGAVSATSLYCSACDGGIVGY
ncbi:MAG: hypothetical protein IJN42_07665, partial [Clostridia bacterium]|nr:hypothetical protein [Clostridia bacterium]